MSPDDLRQKIEMQVVELIKTKLADGTMTEERSQAISQRVLDLLQPGMSFETLYKAISKLDDTASELSPIIVPVLADYEKNVSQKAMGSVQELIAQGQYDAATKLAKKVIQQEVQLTWTGSAKAPQNSPRLDTPATAPKPSSPTPPATKAAPVAPTMPAFGGSIK